MVVKNYLENDENRNVKTTQPLKKRGNVAIWDKMDGS